MHISLGRVDRGIIHTMKRISLPLSRIAIFVIYFWFGMLKLFDLSPASPLVADLQARMIPFVNFHDFMIAFALFEMLIGIVFLIRGLERIAILLLLIHMIMTIMPLLFLPEIAWTSPFVPTLEGQYIIKNLVIIAAAIGIAAHTHLRRLPKMVR